MSTTLTPSQIETYRASGIVQPVRAMFETEAAGLHERYQAQASFLNGRNNQKPHLLFTWLDCS